MMRASSWFFASALLSATRFGFAVPEEPPAVAPALHAELTCAHERVPGRVLCELAVDARQDRLAWADALIVEAPAFARPLRSRVAMGRASLSASERVKLRFALVASAAGQGTLSVRARAVVCHEGTAGEICRPEQQLLSTPLRIGEF
jgi:hypothetical protein